MSLLKATPAERQAAQFLLNKAKSMNSRGMLQQKQAEDWLINPLMTKYFFTLLHEKIEEMKRLEARIADLELDLSLAEAKLRIMGDDRGQVE